ncbi:peroxidase 5-like [Nymphaea colorata]|nr:peroxidase 5-like [Nymphaea colorata]
MKNLSVLCVIFLGLVSSIAATQEDDSLWAKNCHGGLQEDYYQKSCPKAEAIIAHLLAGFIKQDASLPAKLLRLHFHDCFVRGCDASVLLNSTKNNQAEKDAMPNGTLEGFEIIDKLKAALEKACPGVVSCADIVAYAARDSTFQAGLGYRYKVKGGRKDGSISKASEAVQNLPPSTFNVTSLINSFASKGLSADDMVTLSGAHTIGAAHCPSLAGRQFSNYPPKSPLHLDDAYAAKLRKMCPKSGKTVSQLPMDAYTPLILDNKYYVGLLHRKGLFPSDATLLTKSDTQKLVAAYAGDRHYWATKFGAAMIKMGEVQVKTGKQGEVRRLCSRVN